MPVPLLFHNLSIIGQILVLSVIKLPIALVKALLGALKTIGGLLFITIWDLGLFIINVIAPYKQKGSIVPAGKPGHAGIWPTFIAPTDSDSRSPCPYLSEYIFENCFLNRFCVVFCRIISAR